MDLRESGNTLVEIDRRHPWDLARIEVIKRVLRDCVELRAGDLIVDVGCGDSFVAAQLAQSYPALTVHGIDTAFDDRLIDAFTRQLTARNVHLFRTLEEAASGVAHRKAAVILLLDVLEHVDDDVAFLKYVQASPLVDHRTRFVVSAPAFPFLFSMHDRLLGHYRRYSNTTLARQLRGSGLELDVIGYFFSSLLLPRLLQAVKEKIVGSEPRRTRVAAWEGPRFAQRLFARVLVLDFRASWTLRRWGVTLPGLSNLAVCRPSA
jgi:hypothetical protein